MRAFFPSESCKESQLNALNPQSWLQVERGKLSKFSSSSSSSSSSIESFIKVPEPSVLPYYKPLDYVEVLAQIHEELETCPPQERSNLFLLQFQVFRGLGENKLMRRSLRSAWQKATNVHEKLVFGSWLKYEKQGEEVITDLLSSCSKCAEEFGLLDIASYFPVDVDAVASPKTLLMNGKQRTFDEVVLKIGEEKIACDRQKIAGLSTPFDAMLNGSFTESLLDEIDMSKNHISSCAMRIVRDFSVTHVLGEVSLSLLLEVLVFANKFCCEQLKNACDRKLASLVSSIEAAVELMEYALEESCPVLAASCLQVFLCKMPNSLNDDRIVEILTRVNRSQMLTMAGQASFSLYCFLSEVSMNLDPQSEKTLGFLERLVDTTENGRQRILGFHQLGCVRLLRKEYDEAERLFEAAFNLGHVYSAAGLARIGYLKGQRLWAYEKLNAVISAFAPLGWMYQERSLYCEGDKKWKDLEKATEFDPTLTYPFMYRSSNLMLKQNARSALEEINRILRFKLALECLELRFCLYLALEDYEAALCDIQAILTLSPEYRMFDRKVAARQLRVLVREHVENWTTADCWLQLYERWSNVDDIGSLSVIYQMLESGVAKGVLYFRQSLLLLRYVSVFVATIYQVCLRSCNAREE